jgi:hypothetical protein
MTDDLLDAIANPVVHTLTPRARRLNVMANAYATARAIASNPYTAAQVIDAALKKAGFKVVKMSREEVA